MPLDSTFDVTHITRIFFVSFGITSFKLRPGDKPRGNGEISDLPFLPTAEAIVAPPFYDAPVKGD